MAFQLFIAFDVTKVRLYFELPNVFAKNLNILTLFNRSAGVNDERIPIFYAYCVDFEAVKCQKRANVKDKR